MAFYKQLGEFHQPNNFGVLRDNCELEVKRSKVKIMTRPQCLVLTAPRRVLSNYFSD